MTISEERLLELEQLPVGTYYKDLLEKELGINLAEYLALIAGYREAHAIPSPLLRACMDRLKDSPEDELGERLANSGVQ